MNKNLDLDDISIIPTVVSRIKSRNDVDISVSTTGLELGIPIISSPMVDVTDGYVSKIMSEHGGLGIVHRFGSISEQVNQFLINTKGGAAIGINGDFIQRFQALYEVGCRLFCIDVANGATVYVEDAVARLVGRHNDIKLIVGNVASPENYTWCSQLPNVIAVRLNIGTGKSCTTTKATGIFAPRAWLISECSIIKRYYDGKAIIVDGGISEGKDFCKAIALGADAVMLGSLIANTNESPAKLVNQGGNWNYKIYRGSASIEIQQLYRDNPDFIEGKTSELRYEGKTISDVLKELTNGLRSCMTYCNSLSIHKFQSNVEFSV